MKTTVKEKMLKERVMSKVLSGNRDDVAERFEKLIGMPLNSALIFEEFEQFKAAAVEAQNAYDELNKELSCIDNNMQGKMSELRGQAEKLRKEKTKVSAALAECFASGAETGDLFLNLNEVNTRLRQVEDLISVLELQKRYPGTDRTRAKGKALFDAGVKMIRKKVDYNSAAKMYMEILKMLKQIIDAKEEEIAAVYRLSGSLDKGVMQAYAHFNTEYAACKWDELVAAAHAEINKKLKGAL